MAYTALFQGHPVRFAVPSKGALSCAPVLDDVVRVLEAIGVDPALLAGAQTKVAVGAANEFGALMQWLEGLRATVSEITMFQHWLLRHMPNAQVALGLPLLGYVQIQPVVATRPAARQVKRRAA